MLSSGKYKSPRKLSLINYILTTFEIKTWILKQPEMEDFTLNDVFFHLNIQIFLEHHIQTTKLGTQDNNNNNTANQYNPYFYRTKRPVLLL